MPNLSNVESAMAGSQAVVFTATDRKIIEERSGGEVKKSSSFLDAMFQKQTITHKVENEQTTVHPQQDAKELQTRVREHDQLTRQNTIMPQIKERVDITGSTPELKLAAEPRSKDSPKPAENNDNYHDQSDHPKNEENGVNLKPHSEMIAKTAAIAKELNLNPSELFDKFALEQSQLYSLVAKIKELHLKRLLSGNQMEFEALSEEIKSETLASAREEARVWLSRQLDGLTRVAAEYKLNLVKSLQSMHYDDQQDDSSVHWLQTIIEKLA